MVGEKNPKENIPEKGKKFNGGQFVQILASAVAIVAVLFAAYFWLDTRHAQKKEVQAMNYRLENKILGDFRRDVQKQIWETEDYLDEKGEALGKLSSDPTAPGARHEVIEEKKKNIRVSIKEKKKRLRELKDKLGDYDKQLGELQKKLGVKQ